MKAKASVPKSKKPSAAETRAANQAIEICYNDAVIGVRILCEGALDGTADAIDAMRRLRSLSERIRQEASEWRIISEVA
jgi:hypothetical protein